MWILKPTKQGKKVAFDEKVFFVSLENNIKSVFKSVSSDSQDAVAEVSAYKALSLLLGFPYVPPYCVTRCKQHERFLTAFCAHTN